MDKILTIIVGIVGVLAVLFVISLILSLPVMWLWNWLMPELFALKEITLLQAWGLSLLTGLLFKSHTSSSK